MKVGVIMYITCTYRQLACIYMLYLIECCHGLLTLWPWPRYMHKWGVYRNLLEVNAFHCNGRLYLCDFRFCGAPVQRL